MHGGGAVCSIPVQPAGPKDIQAIHDRPSRKGRTSTGGRSLCDPHRSSHLCDQASLGLFGMNEAARRRLPIGGEGGIAVGTAFPWRGGFNAGSRFAVSDREGPSSGIEQARPSNGPSRSAAVRAALAEREGFEPPLPLRVKRFSRPPHSTALPPLQVCWQPPFWFCRGGANVVPCLRRTIFAQWRCAWSSSAPVPARGCR